MFVGVAPAADVDRYLAGSGVRRAASTCGSRRCGRRRCPATGPGRRQPPADGPRWTVSASGSGEQTIDVPVRDGGQRLVIMNADAAAGVDVTAAPVGAGAVPAPARARAADRRRDRRPGRRSAAGRGGAPGAALPPAAGRARVDSARASFAWLRRAAPGRRARPPSPRAVRRGRGLAGPDGRADAPGRPRLVDDHGQRAGRVAADAGPGRRSSSCPGRSTAATSTA